MASHLPGWFSVHCNNTQHDDSFWYWRTGARAGNVSGWLWGNNDGRLYCKVDHSGREKFLQRDKAAHMPPIHMHR